MKKINIILIILLSFCKIQSSTEHHICENKNTFVNKVIQESIKSIKKHALYIALLPILFYYNKNIKDFIMHRPYISSIWFYILLNYTCDTILDYQEQEIICHLIAILKKISLYLIMMHGIKNYMNHNNVTNDLDFTDPIFFNEIFKNYPYSFNQTTSISLKLYQELKIYLQSLNESITIESEEFVFLYHASLIDLPIMLYLADLDQNLYSFINAFEQDPQNNTAPFMQYLKYQLNENFENFKKILLQSQMRSSICL